ncbi:GGDEF domain-containing protein [Kordiimonas pumila]|uniref:diguanylate cyclase n=1 Tax=Kordiimonas pumila TaxID=2161677 RepID=A0ABV7D187_9PROT|nr:GGDEF domain-containing protein [Kordiimonas pumila]
MQGSNRINLILGAVVVFLMVFAFFCPPSPYEQLALIFGVILVVLLVTFSLRDVLTHIDIPSNDWTLDPEMLPEGVIITDLNGNITYYNSLAHKLVPECIENNSISELFNIWHSELVNRQQADEVIQAVLSAPDMQFSELLYLENGRVYERITRAIPNKAIRIWLLRDISHLQSAHSDSNMHATLLEADAARAVELAEQLFHAKTELEAKQAELTRLANTDSLTGLLNRRRFTVLGEQVLKSSLNENIWILMLDIDYFKRINDTFGHAAGDIAIREFAAIVTTKIGKSGFVGRMGGEEFAAILEDCDRDKAIIIAEQIRKETAKHQTVSGVEKFRFTCSIGVAQWQKDEITIEAVLDRADQALYSAKSFGRNRVVGYEVSDT